MQQTENQATKKTNFVNKLKSVSSNIIISSMFLCVCGFMKHKRTCCVVLNRQYLHVPSDPQVVCYVKQTAHRVEGKVMDFWNRQVSPDTPTSLWEACLAHSIAPAICILTRFHQTSFHTFTCGDAVACGWYMPVWSQSHLALILTADCRRQVHCGVDTVATVCHVMH